MIQTYEDLIKYIDNTGFIPFSRNPSGVVSLSELTRPQAWHTGDEYDPWLWKDRVAVEKKASYTRMLGKKLMFISLEWYPYFLSAFRPDPDIREVYDSGTLSSLAYRVYNLLVENGPSNIFALRSMLGIVKEGKYKLDSAVNELQDKMFVTVSGPSRKISKKGEPYGWVLNEYATIEQWIGDEILEKAAGIPENEALDRIRSRIAETTPEIPDREIDRFLGVGR